MGKSAIAINRERWLVNREAQRNPQVGKPEVVAEVKQTKEPVKKKSFLRKFTGKD